MGGDGKNVELGSDQPIDELVANLMQAIHRKGRGFVLGLDRMEDGGVSIEVKESLPPVDEWERPADVREHEIHDTQSFIAFAKAYGDAAKSLVFYNEGGATLTLDETVAKGDRETVHMAFTPSDDYSDWCGVIGSVTDHRRLLLFLLAHEHNLTDPGILASMRRLRLNATVDHESDLQETDTTVGVLVRTSGGEDLAKFPKEFRICVPVLEQDLDENQWRTLTVRLEVVLPTEAGKSATFCLRCAEWPVLLRRRAADEGNTVAEALSDWNVMHGKHVTNERRIGRPNRG